MRARKCGVARWVMVCLGVGLVLALTACAGAATPPLPTTAPSPTLTPPQGGMRGLPNVTPTPVSTDEGKVPPKIMDAVIARLAQVVGQAAGDLKVEVVEVEYVEWPDSSLGCPQRGRMYLPVVTPGYRIVLMANGQQYEFHTDTTGKIVVLCEPGPVSGRSPGMDHNQMPDVLLRRVVRAFAQHLGVKPETLKVREAAFVEWPNTALGCPAPDRGSAEVITLGYRVVLEDAEGTRYEIHTDLGGTRWVWCENGEPQAEGTVGVRMGKGIETLPEEARPAFEKARALVVEKSGLGEDAIVLEAWESVMWRDSSLGCPEPGKVYLQVLTPGYRFVFQAGGATYEVHTDERGRSAVMCKP